MDTRGTKDQSAKQRAARAFDKASQRQKDEDLRVQSQQAASQQMTAKIQRLRALRMERDALEASKAASLPPAKPKKAASRKAAADPA